MSRIPLILAWLTVGVLLATTVRVATSPDAAFTPLALVITVAFVVVAYKITQRHETSLRKDRNVATQDQ